MRGRQKSRTNEWLHAFNSIFLKLDCTNTLITFSI